MAFIFTSEEAAKYLRGNSWAAAVARKLGLEIHNFPLDKKEITSLLEAQESQNFYKSNADNLDT